MGKPAKSAVYQILVLPTVYIHMHAHTYTYIHILFLYIYKHIIYTYVQNGTLTYDTRATRIVGELVALPVENLTYGDFNHNCLRI